MEMRSEAESSTGTEMVLASDGTMSVGGFSTQKKGKYSKIFALINFYHLYIPTNFIHYAQSCHHYQAIEPDLNWSPSMKSRTAKRLKVYRTVTQAVELRMAMHYRRCKT